ncbi:MAG TPA: DUF3299 domain-containing protein [Armatimonadota bacterium]|nr:DUF3299 domain-containing protein [Armatimonadota bacterium]
MTLTLQQQQRRNKHITFGAVIVILIAFAANPIWQAISGPKVPGYLKKAPAGHYTLVNWHNVQRGQWEYGKKPIVPQDVAKLQGKRVCIQGYLLPLHNPGVSSQFFIAPKPRGCYYCNPPGVSEVVQINIKDGKQLSPPDWNWPVKAYGVFHVATGATNDQVLYALNDSGLAIAR